MEINISEAQYTTDVGFLAREAAHAFAVKKVQYRALFWGALQKSLGDISVDFWSVMEDSGKLGGRS